jgi:hypothetical protein
MASKQLHREPQVVQQGVENFDCIGIVRNQDDAMMIHAREDKVEDLEVDFVKFVLRG